MKGYSSDKIRNIALVGHGGCGKTTFIESLLLQTGVINRMGKIEDGNTVSDYDKMEKEKGYSINTSVIPILWKDTKINFVDTPGFFDYIGEVNALAFNLSAIFIFFKDSFIISLLLISLLYLTASSIFSSTVIFSTRAKFWNRYAIFSLRNISPIFLFFTGFLFEKHSTSPLS